MKTRNILLIPGRKPEKEPHFLGTEGKTHVVAYAHVPVGENKTEELKAYFENSIAAKPDWELIGIVTDELKENWDGTCWRNHIPLIRAFKRRHVDILLYKSIENLSGDIASAKFIIAVLGLTRSRTFFAQEDGPLLSSVNLFRRYGNYLSSK